jgi:N-dimethylarginine dimethylaminohydrolase
MIGYLTETFCAREYDVLKRVILCEPKYMTIREVINETQEHFKDVGIHIEIAREQHRKFIDTLKAYNVDVILLPPIEKYHEQVFTRDIGFVLGQIAFVAEMANEVRQGEEDILKNRLEEDKVSYYNLIGDEIEGGDVMIDGKSIYVGLSNRTNQQAIQHLQSLLPEYEVVTVPFEPKYLHLDCVFNVISEHEALYYPGVIEKEVENLLASRYELIAVSKEEQFTLGTNVLSIGKQRVFSLPINKNVNRELRNRGYEVIEVDISEIIKSGGSFRCCTLPLLRESL